ncbi:MAG: nucleotidyltransferase domain-containing protein [Candidatus Kapabacteria bacterium]|nr:nucleotidyltransferase domain-containing protein [Candidatus Kapabacteria bacterium]
MASEQLYRKSIRYIKKLLKEKLPEGSQYFLFGSRAKGTSVNFSDIDIGVISDKKLDDIIIEIKEIIDESFVPYNVDIIDFKKVSKKFKDEAMKKIELWS